MEDEDPLVEIVRGDVRIDRVIVDELANGLVINNNIVWRVVPAEGPEPFAFIDAANNWVNIVAVDKPSGPVVDDEEWI